ncbi:M10 family metallopeptidase C-terminal domain-containing protein [Rhizobium sp. CC-YZS058]|uniref:M10 family metallopeptidase C-terminal domain-containing protein n=1 Tax=Rhizobium sp. CC-YZS058 TaxID=3042153 RepID=UPI002B05FB95|nr:hypothetical protein [Rhizobium sp. CC-YZS058]MEA3534850.1 hypothetical protein [Rhizobium sp. CC-YZS058]
MATYVYGTSGNDPFDAGSGDQLVFAFGGKDAVLFSGKESDYTYTIAYSPVSGATVMVHDNRPGSPDGTDKFYNVEVLQFADKIIDITATGTKFLTSNEPPSKLSFSKASVSEATKVGSVIGTVSARDDNGGALTFALADNAKGLVQLKGDKVILLRALDYETAKSFKFKFTATDADGAATVATMSVSVGDVLETTKGTAKSETLTGGLGKDYLLGLAGADKLIGGGGNDRLNGGAGADKLTGGLGADIFEFSSVSDSAASRGRQDLITDFNARQRDKLDLSDIDANTKLSGNQAFSFIKESAFHGKAGELRFETVKGQTVLLGDTNGDKIADFSVKFDDPIVLKSGDFFL